jgi:hypothetical protein
MRYSGSLRVGRAEARGLSGWSWLLVIVVAATENQPATLCVRRKRHAASAPCLARWRRSGRRRSVWRRSGWLDTPV